MQVDPERNTRKSETRPHQDIRLRVLMAIPRNLVYVFALIILFAFGAMLYIIYFQKDFAYLLEGPTWKVEEIVVHPFF